MRGIRLGAAGLSLAGMLGVSWHFLGKTPHASPAGSPSAPTGLPLPAPPREIPVGAPLPSLTLTDDHGERVTLASLRGAPTVLLFFRATSCPVCRSQLASFAGVEARFQAAGIQVVAASPDPPGALAEMRRDLKLSMRLLSDADEQAVNALCGGLAHCQILADAAGVVRWGAFSESWCHPPPPEALLAALRETPTASATQSATAAATNP
jgi:peroxiredoxin